MHVFNVNLQTGIGGGEVYTGFFLRALAACGVRATLVAAANPAWDTLAAGFPRLTVASPGDLPARLGQHPPAWLVFHTPAGADVVAALKGQGHFVTYFAHMPLYGRDPRPLAAYDAVFPVSGHVRESARQAGLERIYPEPLYGIADLGARPGARPVAAHSPYDWDRRKLRDRVLGALEPLAGPFRRRAPYAKGEGITLGIVSRLTPIKQFPLLFAHLAPVLARHPAFRLEIFGAGGYASVRDLRRALAPLGGRVRFWGHQTDMPSVYGGIDYLLTGLPEKEALGLNVIEAQACGCPVLAVDAPPFTETVAPEVSGLMYRDPREDGGAAFEALLQRLEARPFVIDGKRTATHLARFGEAAFAGRVGDLAGWVGRRLGAEQAQCA